MHTKGQSKHVSVSTSMVVRLVGMVATSVSIVVVVTELMVVFVSMLLVSTFVPMMVASGVLAGLGAKNAPPTEGRTSSMCDRVNAT